MEKIIVKDVTKTFKGKPVLTNVSVTFEQGQIHGIVGRNGSGKTVLIKIICVLMHPDSGYVLVDGKQIGKDVDFPPKIGVIIEAPGFLTYQSGLKNLRYLASLRNIIGEDEIRTAIKQVGLNPDDRKPVGKYSMGMKQRLGLAQAIMEKPEILILDEPMNGLDNDGVSEVRDLLLSLKRKGTTIIIVSHNHEDIQTLCDTVHKMHHGILE